MLSGPGTTSSVRRKIHSDQKDGTSASGGGDPLIGREVFFEFLPVGESMKVTAVEAESGIEVVIAGPVRTAQTELERIALNKLRYVMRQKGIFGSRRSGFADTHDDGAKASPAEPDPDEGSTSNGGKGWIA